MRTEAKARVAIAICLALATALSLAAVAAAQEAAPDTTTSPAVAGARLDGDLAVWPAVTVSLENATANEALAAVAGKLRLDFVAPDAGAGSDRRLTLSMKKRPGREALETILEVAGMRASIRGGMLVVMAEAEEIAVPDPQPAPVPVPAEAVAPPADVDAKKGRGHGRHDGKRQELVRFGEPLRVEVGEVVDEAVAVGGPLTIAGTVLGDAVSVGDSVTLEPTATVEGDVVSIGGQVDVQPGATVLGDRVAIGGPLGGMVGKLASERGGDDLPVWLLAFLGIVSAFVKCAVLLLVGLFVITFLPERSARVRDHLTRRPGRSALTGLVMVLAIVPLCVLLAVTLIGIPLIPIAGLLLFLFMALGMTAFTSWLGDRLPIFSGRKSQFGAMALGTAVVFLVSIIPVVGGIAVTALSFISAGAALLTKFGAPPKDAPLDGEGATATV